MTPQIVCLTFLVVCLMTVHHVSGQVSAVVSCDLDASGDPRIVVDVTGGTAHVIYVIGCATASAAITGDQTVTMDSCPVTYDTSYSVWLSTDGVLTIADDLHYQVSCTQVTGTQTPSAGLTVSTPTATETVTHSLSPTVLAKITDSTGTFSSTALTSAAVGQTIRFHVYIDEAAFRTGANAFDIALTKVTLDNGVNTAIILTGGTNPGCQAHAAWGPVQEIGQGLLMVEFDAFMLVPHTGSVDIQNFEAIVWVCVGDQCVDASNNPLYDCSGASAPFNSPATQYGRRRRAITDPMTNDTTVIEEVKVTGTMKVVPYEGYQDEQTQVDVVVQDGQSEQCEVCMQKSVMYGVMAMLVLLLLLSIAVSCFLFMRTRKSRKFIDYDGEMKGSSNPGYRQ